MLCKYCGGEGKYLTNVKLNSWCCSSTFYKCPGYKDKLSKSSNNDNPWNKGLSKDSDERVRLNTEKSKQSNKEKGYFWKGYKHSQVSKSLISSSMLGNYNAKHRGDRQSYYKGIRMDSSWEVKVAQYLDSQNIGWEYGSIVLPIEGSTYRPDFKLANGTYIEVKGYWREANKLKFYKVLETYPELCIEVWDKEKLKQLNIL